MSEPWFKVGVVFAALLMLYDYYFHDSKFADASFAYMSFFTGNSNTYEPQPNRKKTPPRAPAQKPPAQQALAKAPAQAPVTAKSSMDVATTTPEGAQASSDASNTGSIERAFACENSTHLKFCCFHLSCCLWQQLPYGRTAQLRMRS